MASTVIEVRLKPFLEANGLTAYQLAQASGMAEQTVYSIVRGHRKPSLESLNTILNALSGMVKRPVRLEEVVTFSFDGEAQP